MNPITFEVPIRTSNEANGTHGHWAVKAKKRDTQRSAAMRCFPRWQPAPALVIKLVRIAPRRLDDDGLRLALKSIRDGIASKLKIDDATPLVKWDYDQERGEPHQQSVRVEIHQAGAP